jgi:hypothetical protein
MEEREKIVPNARLLLRAVTNGGTTAVHSVLGLHHRRCVHIALAVLTTSWTGIAFAAPIFVQQILGDWEIVGLLATEGFSNSKRFMSPDDPQVMGRKYSFQIDSITFDNELKRCKLDTSLVRQTFSMKALFAEERIQRPKLIRDRFYRRAAQYALGSLARESVRVYAYKCEKTDGREAQINNTGNWFAATKDTIIWPLASDALVIMKRPPTIQTTEQKAFCDSATNASDKAICADREMWLMKSFTDTVRECAIAYELRTPDKLRQQIDVFVAKRNACEGTRACIYATLDSHASLLAQYVHSVPDCLELKKSNSKLMNFHN